MTASAPAAGFQPQPGTLTPRSATRAKSASQCAWVAFFSASACSGVFFFGAGVEALKLASAISFNCRTTSGVTAAEKKGAARAGDARAGNVRAGAAGGASERSAVASGGAIQQAI